MMLKDILSAKGATVHSVSPDATLAEVAKKLVECKIGALLICQRDVEQGEQILGIVTERDLLYYSAESHLALGDVPVGQIMTTDLITGSPDDPVEKVMGLMTEKRIRHLPVLSEGRLVGIVSIGDIVKTQHAQLTIENRFLKDYIRG